MSKMIQKSIYDPDLADWFLKSEIPKEFYFRELKGVDDTLEVYVHQTEDNSGFKFFAGETFSNAEASNLAIPKDQRPKKIYHLRIYSEGWAAFDGLRHITTYWNYIDWDLKDEYYNLMRQLEEKLCGDFTGYRLNREQFSGAIKKLGFATVKEFGESFVE